MNSRLAYLIGIIAFAALFRILPHPPNVAPIAAMALFAGASFDDRRLAWLVPLAALLVSDVVIGLHATLPFVYLAFGLTVLIGFALRGRVGFVNVTLAALGSSVLFFVITNFGTWAMQDLYPKTPAGLLACYTAAIPFFRNTVFGDLAFAALLFGAGYLLNLLFVRHRARAAA